MKETLIKEMANDKFPAPVSVFVELFSFLLYFFSWFCSSFVLACVLLHHHDIMSYMRLGYIFKVFLYCMKEKWTLFYIILKLHLGISLKNFDNVTAAQYSIVSVSFLYSTGNVRYFLAFLTTLFRWETAI